MKNIPSIDSKIIIGYSNLSSLFSKDKTFRRVKTNKEDNSIKILK